MSSLASSENEWIADLYSLNNSSEEVKYYEKTACDYETTLKGLNYAAPDLCLLAVKKVEEKTGLSITICLQLLSTNLNKISRI